MAVSTSHSCSRTSCGGIGWSSQQKYVGSFSTGTHTRIGLRRARQNSRIIVAEAEERSPGDDSSQSSSQTRLSSVLKNKQRIVQAQLAGLGQGQLENRLSSARRSPSPYKLSDTIAGQLVVGKTTIVAEIARLSPSESLESFSRRCVQYVEWGADALAVCTNEELSPNGALDLATACQAVNVPILRKDWIIHPLQVAESSEAGASAISAVFCVLGKGTQSILQYAANLGLDPIVEIVNLQELQTVLPIQAPLYGINISVGLSVPIPGFGQDIAKSLVGELPFGATSIVITQSTVTFRLRHNLGPVMVRLYSTTCKGISQALENVELEQFLTSVMRRALTSLDKASLMCNSMEGSVGVRSIEEAILMKAEKADAVYVKHEILQGTGVGSTSASPRTFLIALRDAMTGDD